MSLKPIQQIILTEQDRRLDIKVFSHQSVAITVVELSGRSHTILLNEKNIAELADFAEKFVGCIPYSHDSNTKEL